MFGKKRIIKWYKLFSSPEEAMDRIPLNTAVKVMLGDDEVCLARTKTGFYALGDHCPHQGFPLHHGTCNEENEIICPYHRYKFNLLTGKSHSEQCNAQAVIHPVRIEKKGLFIGAEKETRRWFWFF